MAGGHGAAKSGVLLTEFYLRRTTHLLSAVGALSPNKTFAARGEIDEDHPGKSIVGSLWFFNWIGSATDAELSRAFHERNSQKR